MSKQKSVFIGPRIKRLRRDLGLTQAQMAADIEISPSYVALIERNQRPLTADLLLKLARTYNLDLAAIAGDESDDEAARLQAALNDPMFADIDLPALETADVAASFPGITEAFLRLHTAFREEQLLLADRAANAGEGASAAEWDPVAEARRFLSSRRNSFPALDDAAERLAQRCPDLQSLKQHFQDKHGLRVRRIPVDVMAGALRRHDLHRKEVLLSDVLDSSAQAFQLALQWAHLELRQEIADAVGQARFETESGRKLAHRSLANYAAAAWMMPYTAFAKAVVARKYDVEALARQFGVSFEQAAHRLTTLQKPGHERIPFFFARIDQAGNVSKRLDGAGFPFARHGGACPLWNVHSAFQNPGEVLTQWLELPDGERFFSIARTVNAGGGAFGALRVPRAIALCCSAEYADRLIYTQNPVVAVAAPTPIGIACRLCHRPNCIARSALPSGLEVQTDEFRESNVPFGLFGRR